MKITDFLENDALNALRKKMGAEQLGQFELFDPQKQLTYSEREALADGTLAAQAGDLRVLKDKTLAYKNSRLWLTHNDHYHLAYCQQVQGLRHHQHDDALNGGSGKPGDDHDVCVECLALLQYQGIDARRLRREEFIEQLKKDFCLDEFKQSYPFYPV